MQESIQPPPPSREDIALLAHQLWEKNGRPAGQDVEFWLQAEQALRASAKPQPQAASLVTRGAKPPPGKPSFDKMAGQPAKRTAAGPVKGGAAPVRARAN
jgi:hypothetical protein